MKAVMITAFAGATILSGVLLLAQPTRFSLATFVIAIIAVTTTYLVYEEFSSDPKLDSK